MDCVSTTDAEGIRLLHLRRYQIIHFTSALRRNIEKDIRSDLSGNFEKFIVALLQGVREQGLDQSAAEADADALYAAGEKKLGTDEEVFTRIFARRSYRTIRLLDEIYCQKTGHGILKAIEKELSGDYKDAVATVVKTAFKKEECVADMIRDAMKGLGTHDDDLIRLILAYAEDNMAEIKAIFEEKNGKTLESWIKSDTRGDYCRFLMAVVEKC
ncbi:Annexin A7 [Taenia crassiceps]|uniref:Annexin A7 n=1 Tax=Taenia crassiceps TaxID=6207 RepID=A0ABR4QJ34_9CEST